VLCRLVLGDLNFEVRRCSFHFHLTVKGTFSTSTAHHNMEGDGHNYLFYKFAGWYDGQPQLFRLLTRCYLSLQKMKQLNSSPCQPAAEGGLPYSLANGSQILDD